MRGDPENDPTSIDTNVAHPARVYDYLLGGVDHFKVDKEAAERGASALPGGIEWARVMVQCQRSFLASAIRRLAADMGIRQFLDIGTGIPNADNVHAIAQETAPEARVVYIDNDPLVLAHAHALLRSTPQGATAFMHGDLRDPGSILDKAAETLDYTAPVAVVLVGILHLLADEDDPYGIVAGIMDAMAPGSYLVASHLASDVDPELAEAMTRTNETMRGAFVVRSHDEVARFFAGLDLLDPGIVTLDRWPWGQLAFTPDRPVAAYAAVARRSSPPV